MNSEIWLRHRYISPVNVLLLDEPDFRCDAEETFGMEACRIRQDTRDDSSNWIRWHTKTPSGERHHKYIQGTSYPVTGPTFAEQGFYYLYLEASKSTKGELAR